MTNKMACTNFFGRALPLTPVGARDAPLDTVVGWRSPSPPHFPLTSTASRPEPSKLHTSTLTTTDCELVVSLLCVTTSIIKSVSAFVALHRLIWQICAFRYRWRPFVPERSSSRRDLMALSTVALRITQLCCLWSCGLELSTSSCSRLTFISCHELLIFHVKSRQEDTLLRQSACSHVKIKLGLHVFRRYRPSMAHINSS